VQEVTQTADVSTYGFPVVAVNLASGIGSNQVVNGVTFMPYAPMGWTVGNSGLLASSTTSDAGYDVLLDTSLTTLAAATTNPTEWGGIRIDNIVPLNVNSVF